MAGGAGTPQFEPLGRLHEAEKPEIVASWLGILDGIRTALAPGMAVSAVGAGAHSRGRRRALTAFSLDELARRWVQP